MAEQNNEHEVRIRRIVAESLEMAPEELQEDARFIEAYGGDSMLAIEILAQIEREFGVEIPEENLPRMVNLRGVRSVLDDILAASVS